jgi:long-chain acyl-CoA synthetase
LESRFWHNNYDYNVPTSIRYPKFPIQNLVHLAAAQYPHKAAVDFYGTELSNSQIRNQMLRMANALVSLGIKKGDRVGIALPNCPQYIISYYAILSAGAIVVNMNPLYTYDELKFMVENTGMKIMVTFDMVLPLMGKLAKDLKFRLIVTKVTDYINGFGVSTAKDMALEKDWHHFSDLLDKSTDTRLPRIDFLPGDDALIQFTGGTTGLPKGAVLTHANVVASAFSASFWGNSTVIYTPYERRTVMGIIPYFHIYANICCLNWGFISMATQILMPKFDMDELIATIARIERFTFFPTVPTMITALVNHPKAGELKLAEKIGYFNSGGAPMPVELIQKVKDMGIYFSEGWGMSETTSLGISNPGLKHKAGAIGVPIMDNDVKLVSVDNGVDEVKRGEPGEILIKGPTVMRGYWNNPEETANQLTDGWLHTGDVGQMDEEGYIYIVDRKKDMIIAGGFNIYPREVDEVLYQHPKVAEGVTVGIPDAYRGETVKVFIVLKPGEKATDKDIIEFCKQKLAAYKVPKIVEFRDSIPKSAVGKILRKVLRDEEIAKSKSKK